jgi:hypothetical protein
MTDAQAVTVDGITLIARKGEPGSYDDLRARVQAIADRFGPPAAKRVSQIYLDDKCCAWYEIDLAADLPSSIAAGVAKAICRLFRETGYHGYNGLVIRYHGHVLLEDDAWWDPELDEREPLRSPL